MEIYETFLKEDINFRWKHERVEQDHNLSTRHTNKWMMTDRKNTWQYYSNV